MNTPVEYHDGIWLKRDDLFEVAGAKGGKARSCEAICRYATQGLITASSRSSPQAEIVAAIGAAKGLPVRLHMPHGKATPSMDFCAGLGATIIQHRPGYNTQIVARAREDRRQHAQWTLVPFGMETELAVAHTAAQAGQLLAQTRALARSLLQTDNRLAQPVQRVVVPVGSGMTLCGILRALAHHLPILGVQVGASPVKRLARFYGAGWRNAATLVDVQASQGWGYGHPVQATANGVPLDPHYEAKCQHLLKPGDLLWIVGHRRVFEKT